MTDHEEPAAPPDGPMRPTGLEPTPPASSDPAPPENPPSEIGPEVLIEAIDERAEQERARVMAEAHARVTAILAEADAECARLKSEALDGLEKELAAEQLRLLGEAVLHARSAGLERRRALLAEVFRRAAEELSRRQRGTESAAAQAELAREARAAVGEPCAVEVTADGEIRAVSEDGRRSAENGLAGRLQRAQLSLEHEVARLLFGSPREPGTLQP